jgi:hypothetical protein
MLLLHALCCQASQNYFPTWVEEGFLFWANKLRLCVAMMLLVTELPPSPLLLCSVAGISCCWSVGEGQCQEINLFISH